MAVSSAISITGGAHFESCKLHYYKNGALDGNHSRLSYPLKLNQFRPRRSFSLRAEYSDGPRSGGGDFLAGFILGGAIFGTLAYVFAPKVMIPFVFILLDGCYHINKHFFLVVVVNEIYLLKIRRSIMNEDEYGFQRAKRPIYYDEGLEKTRQTLNEKISQLNSAIDNVSSRLRGGSTAAPEAVEVDSEVEASM